MITRMRHLRILRATVLVFWLVLASLFVVNLGGTGQDDFFITYRYARNLVHGEGLVFNIGERHFGVTEPGLALLLAGLHRLSCLPIPWLGTLITAFSLLAIALLMLFETSQHDRSMVGILGGTLLMGSTWIWILHGAAAPLVLLCLLASASIIAKRPATAGFLAGAAILFRPDAAVGALLLGILEWRRRRQIPLIFGLSGVGLAVLGAMIAWAYFGHPLPGTLSAKRAMAEWQPTTWPSGFDFWLTFLPGWRLHLGWLALPLLFGGFTGWAPMWRKGGATSRLLILNSLALAIAYPLLGVPFYAWYTIPIVVSLLYGLAYLGAELAAYVAGSRLLQRSGARSLRSIQIGICGTILFAVGIRAIPLFIGYRGDPHLTAYRQVGEWLYQNTASKTTIGFYEVGVIGWYSERQIVDLLGLVTPGVVNSIRRGNLGDTLHSFPVDLVIDHTSRRVGNLPDQPWFLNDFEAVVRFPDAGGGEVVVYRRRSGSKNSR